MGISARSDSLVAWEYWHQDISDPVFRQHSDRLIPVMMRFIRGFLGPDWTPVRLEVAYDSSRTLRHHEDATQTAWVCNQPKVAIVMRSVDLQSPGPQRARSLSPLLGYADVVADAKLGSIDSEVACIGATISLRLLEGADDIDGAAKALGLSVRTLQRRLDANALSYRSLLSSLRMQRAKSLVMETDAPLKQIGLQLGYSEPAHFTRAFRKHFGCAPSSLRR
jgi:AraC-like DNA-binding protein